MSAPPVSSDPPAASQAMSDATAKAMTALGLIQEAVNSHAVHPIQRMRTINQVAALYSDIIFNSSLNVALQEEAHVQPAEAAAVRADDDVEHAEVLEPYAGGAEFADASADLHPADGADLHHTEAAAVSESAAVSELAPDGADLHPADGTDLHPAELAELAELADLAELAELAADGAEHAGPVSAPAVEEVTADHVVASAVSGSGIEGSTSDSEPSLEPPTKKPRPLEKARPPMAPSSGSH